MSLATASRDWGVTAPVADLPAARAARSSPKVFTGDHNRLAGRSLRYARFAWLSIVLATVVLFVAALPARYAELVATLRDLTPAQQLVLADLGVSGEQHARLVFSVEIAVALVFVTVGFLIFTRRSDDWIAMLVSLSLVTYAAWITPPLRALAAVVPALQIPIMLVQIVGLLSTATAFFVFPSGRFVPRWSALVIPLLGLWALGWLLFPSSALNLANPYRMPLPTFVVSTGWWALGLGCQVYRFVHETSAVRRRQTKFVLIALVIGVCAYLIFGFDRFAVPVVAEPVHASVVYDLIGVPIYLVIVLVIPISFAVSILRHRLWEIELIINQALVYGALTAIVAGLFPATLTTCQRIFIALTGEKSDLAAVAVTLIFASTLTPLKNRLQLLVDRSVRPLPRAPADLRIFAEHVRSIVDVFDVEQLTRRTLDEAIRAFDATGGAVYLLGEHPSQPVYVLGDWTQVEGITATLEDGGIQYGRIALGPRHGGMEYTRHDEEMLAESARQVARAIKVVQRAGLLDAVKSSPKPSGATAAAKG
jgi:hypothetical protein